MPVTINGSDGITNASWTTGTRPSNPVAGQMGFNTETNALEFYNPILDEWRPIFAGVINATGGSVSDITVNGIQYRVHAFTSVGTSTFEVIDGNGVADVLVVAGGGSGAGGGGGAGGLAFGSVNISEQTYTVKVGAGGPGTWAAFDSGTGDNGNDSEFDNITALGGGGGGGNATGGADGGSGGGTGPNSTSNGGSALQSGTNTGIETGTNTGIESDLGSNGGNGFDGNRPNATAGGGGARESGGDAIDQFSPGNGGDGISFENIFSDQFGENGHFAGGAAGGGMNDTSSTNTNFLAAGGLGGGAEGSNNINPAPAGALPNTGGGGAHGSESFNAGPGGSGIVLIRYRIG